MTTENVQTDVAEETGTRCGFVALIGAPNAGKSTLSNQLVGSKISIVSHKVQTTRARIRAIAVHEASQIILVDTPGIFEPKRKLDEAMVEAAWTGAGDADAIAVIVDARRGIDEDVTRIIEGISEVSRPVLLVLNKIDTVERSELLAIASDLNERCRFVATYMVSALNGDGVSDLMADLAGRMPAGPWLYPEDQMADVPLRLLAAEITREKVYQRLHDELPYASTVETEQWQQRKDGSIRIEQVVYVERDGQKKIVLGKGGQTIKAIGQDSRKDLEAFLDTRVHLFLFVKVRGRWSEDPERFRQMGLDFPKAR